MSSGSDSRVVINPNCGELTDKIRKVLLVCDEFLTDKNGAVICYSAGEMKYKLTGEYYYNNFTPHTIETV
jgi:hypothetical protein